MVLFTRAETWPTKAQAGGSGNTRGQPHDHGIACDCGISTGSRRNWGQHTRIGIPNLQAYRVNIVVSTVLYSLRFTAWCGLNRLNGLHLCGFKTNLDRRREVCLVLSRLFIPSLLPIFPYSRLQLLYPPFQKPGSGGFQFCQVFHVAVKFQVREQVPPRLLPASQPFASYSGLACASCCPRCGDPLEDISDPPL